MVSFTLFAFLSLIPGLGLLILKKWIRAFVVIFFFIILSRAYLYNFDDGIAMFLLLILAMVWLGQFIYSTRLYQAIEYNEHHGDGSMFEDEEADEFNEDEDDGGDLEREYLEGPEIPPEYYLDPSAEIKGWPGNRTRPGRSGYDPLEIDFEYAQMWGRFIHHLITGTLISNEPIYQVLLGIIGVICVAPTFLALVMVFLGDLQLFLAATISSPLVLVGLGFLISLRRSISKDEQGKRDDVVIVPEPVSDQKVWIGKIILFSLVGLYLLIRAIMAIGL